MNINLNWEFDFNFLKSLYILLFLLPYFSVIRRMRAYISICKRHFIYHLFHSSPTVLLSPGGWFLRPLLSWIRLWADFRGKATAFLSCHLARQLCYLGLGWRVLLPGVVEACLSQIVPFEYSFTGLVCLCSVVVVPYGDNACVVPVGCEIELIHHHHLRPVMLAVISVRDSADLVALPEHWVDFFCNSCATEQLVKRFGLNVDVYFFPSFPTDRVLTDGSWHVFFVDRNDLTEFCRCDIETCWTSWDYRSSVVERILLWDNLGLDLWSGVWVVFHHWFERTFLLSPSFRTRCRESLVWLLEEIICYRVGHASFAVDCRGKSLAVEGLTLLLRTGWSLPWISIDSSHFDSVTRPRLWSLLCKLL